MVFVAETLTLDFVIRLVGSRSIERAGQAGRRPCGDRSALRRAPDAVQIGGRHGRATGSEANLGDDDATW